MPLLAISPDFKVRYANNAVSNITGVKQDECIGQNCYDLGRFDACKEGDGSCACGLAMNKDEVISDQTKTVLADGNEFHMQYSGTPIKSKDGKVVGVIETAMDMTSQVNEKQRLEKISNYQRLRVNDLVKNINILASGNFNLNFEEFETDDEVLEIYTIFEEVNHNFKNAVDTINGYVIEISEVLRKLSESNLNQEVSKDYIGDFSKIKLALNTIIDSYNHVIKNINHSSLEVLDGSNKMSVSSQNLSSGATEQAAAVEEISATVTEVSTQASENAKNASQVNVTAENSVQQIEHSNEVMQKLSVSMKDIQKSTNNIQKILKMINDIAFQTNILSLNAAVEAARAGQHGRGFAVIAEDVRSLALKSASSAEETSEMLESMVSQINETVDYVVETESSLAAIYNGTEETARLSRGVADASNEQAIAMGQITLSLDQISQVVQNTSVNAQESAMVSEKLNHESIELMNIVGDFEVKGLDKDSYTKTEKLLEKSSKKEDVNEDIIINLGDDIF